MHWIALNWSKATVKTIIFYNLLFMISFGLSIHQRNLNKLRFTQKYQASWVSILIIVKNVFSNKSAY